MNTYPKITKALKEAKTCGDIAPAITGLLDILLTSGQIVSEQEKAKLAKLRARVHIHLTEQ